MNPLQDIGSLEKKLLQKKNKLDFISNESDIFEQVQTLQQISKDFDSNPLNIQMIDMFKIAGGNRDRFKILFLLTQHEYSVSELQDIIQKSQPTISRHLGLLEDANIIKAEKRGKLTYYKPLKASLKIIQEFMSLWINSITNWFGDSYNA
ncbi:MAG: ArsR/SmtB family transcription factor [Promethearchaeota archaeon]